MNGACLIPSTRKSLAEVQKSCRKYGWDPIIFKDKDKSGPCESRNTLLTMAKDYDLIRYVDDDDLVLGFSPQDFLESDVVVYFNHITVIGNFRVPHRFAGFPDEDSRLIGPWSWVARRDFLESLAQPLWDPAFHPQEGLEIWLKIMRATTKIRFDRGFHYQWNRGLGSEERYRTLRSQSEKLEYKRLSI
jgi:glycosyltransferase involved in cell wall biosynthesis